MNSEKKFVNEMSKNCNVDFFSRFIYFITYDLRISCSVPLIYEKDLVKYNHFGIKDLTRHLDMTLFLKGECPIMFLSCKSENCILLKANLDLEKENKTAFFKFYENHFEIPFADEGVNIKRFTCDFYQEEYVKKLDAVLNRTKIDTLIY